MTDYEKLKTDMEGWLRQLGIEPPMGIHDYVPLAMNHLELCKRQNAHQYKEYQEEIAAMKQCVVNSHILLRQALSLLITLSPDAWFYRGVRLCDNINDELSRGVGTWTDTLK